ncbi:MAG: hypothetical protein IT287_01280 [Bdellovibrionaceae bacterium]|nr:hypothetical protein [Pseudobdellovibrionaceae bacterium]
MLIRHLNKISLTKVLLFLLLTLPAVSFAETIFEGYYKVSMEGQHIGYYIQRYALDGTTKLFASTHYMLLKVDHTTTIESLSAKSTAKFEPRSYQYTQLDGSKTKVIDAVVNGKKLAIKTIEGGKTTARESSINEKVFLSTFLPFLILKTPKGLAVGNKFTYDAIAEEDGSTGNGEIYVKEQVKEAGLDAFRTLNTYKKEQFINWLDAKGESLKTFVPHLNLTSELMRDPKEAYKNLPFNESTIKLLFGGIPEGKTNMLFSK